MHHPFNNLMLEKQFFIISPNIITFLQLVHIAESGVVRKNLPRAHMTLESRQATTLVCEAIAD